MQAKATLTDSRHVELSWRLKAPVDKVMVSLCLLPQRHHPEHHCKQQPRGLPSGDKPGDKWRFKAPGDAISSYNVPLMLQPGREYTAAIKACVLIRPRQGSKTSPMSYGVTQQNTVSFRAVFTTSELQRLYDKAIEFMEKSNMRESCLPLQWFYRDKPDRYYAHIFSQQGGVMDAYIKDRNGDPASPINEQINGLFFAVNVHLKSGQPLVPSNFGPQRFMVPASVMFDMLSNLYFTDFYCTHKAHYVTLVMTRPGTPNDAFCRKKLLKLDVGANPFVEYDVRTGAATVTTRVWVEILFTEDVDMLSVLAKGAYLSHVPSRGVSRPDGISKNDQCPECNLYRPGRAGERLCV